MTLISIIIEKGVIIPILFTWKTKCRNGHENTLKTKNTQFYSVQLFYIWGLCSSTYPANEFPDQMLTRLFNLVVFIFIQKQFPYTMSHFALSVNKMVQMLQKSRQRSLKTLTYQSRIVKFTSTATGTRWGAQVNIFPKAYYVIHIQEAA